MFDILGGLQDYNYLYAGCFELTLELHCCKFSPVSVLEERWNENKDALINFLMSVHIGNQSRDLWIGGVGGGGGRRILSGMKMLVRGKFGMGVRGVGGREFIPVLNGGKLVGNQSRDLWI